jgi:16S rRNA (cytidine1402-2'-O)-methyltransferase
VKGEPTALEPALYLVATPIGAARDITLRALDILASADVIAAEDTRNTRHLLEMHGVALGGRPLIAYHDHNGASVRPKLIAHLAGGRSLAYVSDAGTPLVADPGYALARAAIEEGFPVRAAPGPSAVLAALSVSGLPTDRFFFAGFPPPKQGARTRFFEEIRDVPGTLVFFESPKRLSQTLKTCVSVLGDRDAAVARELTKKFEEVRRGPLSELANWAGEGLRGEVVVLIDRGHAEARPEDMERELKKALETMRTKDAAAEVAKALGLPRRDVYQAALRLAGEG